MARLVTRLSLFWPPWERSGPWYDPSPAGQGTRGLRLKTGSSLIVISRRERWTGSGDQRGPRAMSSRRRLILTMLVLPGIAGDAWGQDRARPSPAPPGDVEPQLRLEPGG